MKRNVRGTAIAAAALSLAGWFPLQSFAQQGAIIQDPDVYFDLGIDVTQLPQDAAGAKAFLAKQVPETQHALRAACDTYVKHPADAEMPQTIKFCQFILAP